MHSMPSLRCCYVPIVPLPLDLCKRMSLDEGKDRVGFIEGNSLRVEDGSSDRVEDGSSGRVR